MKHPGEKDIFCHAFENGHDLLFSFSGTGGSNGAIQALALDATRKSANIIINSLYRPLAYNNKTLELIFGENNKLFYGHFLWNNHDKKIVFTKKYLFSCHLKVNQHYGAKMYKKITVCTKLANHITQKNWKWFY